MKKLEENKQILLVDDEDSIHLLYRAEFEDEFGDSIEIVSFFRAGSALNFLKEQDADLIISAINLPGMNGIDFLKECKKHYPHIPFIIFTSYQEFKQDSLGWECDAYIVKSSDPESLLNEARRLLNKEPRKLLNAPKERRKIGEIYDSEAKSVINDLEELSSRACKGDKDALLEIFKTGEGLQESKLYKEAAATYKKSAIAYRITAYRHLARAEEAEQGLVWLAVVIKDIYREWIASNPSGLRELPWLNSSVDSERIREIVVDQLSQEDKFNKFFIYLEATLSDMGMKFYSPGGSIQRRVFCILEEYFGIDEDRSGVWATYLENVTVRIAIDQIADEVVKRCERDQQD